jgi:hypothetical protein
MQNRSAFIAAWAVLSSLAVFTLGPARASLPGPLTVKDVDLRLVSPIPKLRLKLDDWSPGREYIEILCIVQGSVLNRCRVDSAINAEREAINWAFEYASKVRLPLRDRNGGSTSGRTLLLKWDLRPAG